MKETLEYQNFRFIEQVPHCFDQFYLCGIGPICSEFYGGEGEFFALPGTDAFRNAKRRSTK